MLKVSNGQIKQQCKLSIHCMCLSKYASGVKHPNSLSAFAEGHAADVTGCDFGNQCLATCSSDKTVRLFERCPEGQFVEKDFSPLAGHTYALTAVRFAACGTLLCSSSVDGTCIIWNVEVCLRVGFLLRSRLLGHAERRRLEQQQRTLQILHTSGASVVRQFRR